MEPDLIEFYSQVLPALARREFSLTALTEALTTTAKLLKLSAWRFSCLGREVLASAHNLGVFAIAGNRIQLSACPEDQTLGTLECVYTTLSQDSLMALQAVTDLCVKLFVLDYKAHHDKTTGLYNRTFLNEYLERRHEAGDHVVVANIDVDGLKAANDSRGHDHGDWMLCRVADALRACGRDYDLAFRSGGDEFLLILTRVPARRVSWLKSILAQRFEAALQTLNPVAFSYGIVGGSEADLKRLMTSADRKMYEHKRRNRWETRVPRPLVNLNHHEQIDLF